MYPKSGHFQPPPPNTLVHAIFPPLDDCRSLSTHPVASTSSWTPAVCSHNGQSDSSPSLKQIMSFPSPKLSNTFPSHLEENLNPLTGPRKPHARPGLPHQLYLPPLCSSTPPFFLFLKQAKVVPTSVPLPSWGLLPESLSSQLSHGSLPHSLLFPHKCDLHRETAPPPPPALILSSFTFLYFPS